VEAKWILRGIAGSGLANGPWYASGLFWGVAGAAIGLAALAAALIIWRVGAPPRLLIYSLPISTSLLTTHSQDFGLGKVGLEVTYLGQVLSNPYVVVLSVDSRSRKDIGSADFDQGLPLVFRLGVPIRGVLDSQVNIDSNAFEVDDDTVRLKPVLIRRGPVLQLTILTDGPPHLTCQNNLIDVKVREQSPEELGEISLGGSLLLAPVIAVSLLLSSLVMSSRRDRRS
jgi:hypothetical protein